MRDKIAWVLQHLVGSLPCRRLWRLASMNFDIARIVPKASMYYVAYFAAAMRLNKCA